MVLIPNNWGKRVHPISCCSVLPATMFYAIDPPPELGGWELIVDGQEIDGTYALGSVHNGTFAFTIAGDAWSIWWSEAPHGWFITPEIGVLVETPGSMWYKLADPDPRGVYTAQNPANANVTVSEPL